jgi:hypothetical protein
MPEELFFSRRIVDPQFGVKLTGSVGRWGVGALAADDRAPGEVLAQGETGHGDRAFDGVFRVEREFGHQSHAGLFLSDTSFQSKSNRVASVDLRYLTTGNWNFAGQATSTQSEQNPSGYLAGPGYVLSLSKQDLHANFESFYTDRSPGLSATLGYMTRPDIREWETYYSYKWKPAGSRTVLSYGPSMDALLNYDHEKRLENWSVVPGFSISLPRLTTLSLTHQEAYELYQGVGFRERGTTASLITSWFSWLDLTGIYSEGIRPNYYPPEGVVPFAGKANNVSATVTLWPQSHLRLDEIYYYTRLAIDSTPAQPQSGDIFTNHLVRSKINYQFTPDYSFRAILDYNALLPNKSLVSCSYAKQADATLLFTYLPHPGTAFYMGYADTFQNMDYDAAATPQYTTTDMPTTSTDRQIFVKFSYLVRF